MLMFSYYTIRCSDHLMFFHQVSWKLGNFPPFLLHLFNPSDITLCPNYPILFPFHFATLSLKMFVCHYWLIFALSSFAMFEYTSHIVVGCQNNRTAGTMGNKSHIFYCFLACMALFDSNI